MFEKEGPGINFQLLYGRGDCWGTTNRRHGRDMGLDLELTVNINRKEGLDYSLNICDGKARSGNYCSLRIWLTYGKQLDGRAHAKDPQFKI